MGPGDEDLGPPRLEPADLHHIDLQPVAFPHHFAPDLLRGGRDRRQWTPPLLVMRRETAPLRGLPG